MIDVMLLLVTFDFKSHAKRTCSFIWKTFVCGVKFSKEVNVTERINMSSIPLTCFKQGFGCKQCEKHISYECHPRFRCYQFFIMQYLNILLQMIKFFWINSIARSNFSFPDHEKCIRSSGISKSWRQIMNNHCDFLTLSYVANCQIVW